MYLIKIAMKKTIDDLLKTQNWFPNLNLESARSRKRIPALTYQWDEFAEIEDNVKNGLLTITFLTIKDKSEILHNKLIGFLKKGLNEKGFNYTDPQTQDNINGRFIFNSISDISSQDDSLETNIIFDLRFFQTENCDCNI